MEASVAQQLVGKTVLLTVDNWFYAPNGKQYRAIFGTLRGVHTAEATLGVRPNGKSANWYIEIGDMVVAGCQVNYALRCDAVNFAPVGDYASDAEHGAKTFERPSHIYNADAGDAALVTPLPGAAWYRVSERGEFVECHDEVAS